MTNLSKLRPSSVKYQIENDNNNKCDSGSASSEDRARLSALTATASEAGGEALLADSADPVRNENKSTSE